MDPKYDVYVYLPSEDDEEYVFITSCSSDMGEILAACEVLYPNLTGIDIRPFKEHTEDPA